MFAIFSELSKKRGSLFNIYLGIFSLLVAACACIAGWLALPPFLKAWDVIIPSKPIEYKVRVQIQETGEPISNAKVTIDVSGGIAPVPEFTDGNGLARIFIDSSQTGKAARLIVEAEGYQVYVENIDLEDGALPHIILLKPTPTTRSKNLLSLKLSLES